MPPQSRLGDKALIPADAHGCPACPHTATGPAIAGSANVFVNGRPAIRVDDPGIHAACCGPNTWNAKTGSRSVLINGRSAHRLGDLTKHCGGMGQTIEGSQNVIVGDISTKQTLSIGSSPNVDACSPTTVTCPPDCPTKVEFKEYNTVYGFDDKTDAAIPWKSVEKGKSDTAKAEITPAEKFAKVQFISSDTAKVTVSPAMAASGSQVVTVTGVDDGESEIKATCGGSDLGKMKVKTYSRKTKTVAVRLVHEKNYTSTDISDDDIKARLKKVFEQAVLEFTVTRLPAKTVEFDTVTTTKKADGSIKRTIGADGKIDVDSWMSDEMKAVRDACKDDSYDFNIFIVNNPSDGSFGFMDYNQRYGFIHADKTTTPLKSFSHELGHGLGLEHRQTDTDNLMKQGEGDNMWRLRKDQWDKINP